MEQELKLFVATKAFIVAEGKILILRESNAYSEGTNVGRYDVPGGRLKPGERFDEALLREIQEETGLTVTIDRPIAMNEWRPVVKGEPWQIVATFFRCDAPTTQITLSEDHDAYEWIVPSDYERYPMIENLKSVFQAFLRQQGNE